MTDHSRSVFFSELRIFHVGFYVHILPIVQFKRFIAKENYHRAPHLSYLHVIPHPPMPYVIRAWWTSSTGTAATSSCPRTVGGRRRLGGCVPVAVRAGGLPPGRGFGFTRATSISTTQNHSHPVILHPKALQWSEQAERTSIQQKKRRRRQLFF